ncbi:hypothetical protein EII34_06945 [Arachnia propionica]|uniref:Lipoprotein n=1 Tax=Arachnia propionica TaxID=1750 RepID=A0A3P1T7Z9_9ACTN|nr:hypothetical protein [Arachnia propionica]RRD05460.1 hypothetical protein EII34_06945 [Arachnia propionica]
MRASTFLTLPLGVCSLGLISCAPPQAAAPSSTATTPQAWDPNAWEPPVKVTLKTYTEEERWALRAELLKHDEPKNSPVPGVELIRWTEGPAEHWTTVAQCLTERGFPAEAEVDSRGVIFPNGGSPEEQDDALEIAWYVCQAEYSLDPRYHDDWNEEQLGVVYDYFTQHYIPCMKAHDQPVNEKNKPTRDVYIATYNDEDADPWWPYPVAVVPQHVKKACPELPPDKALYGG